MASLPRARLNAEPWAVAGAASSCFGSAPASGLPAGPLDTGLWPSGLSLMLAPRGYNEAEATDGRWHSPQHLKGPGGIEKISTRLFVTARGPFRVCGRRLGQFSPFPPAGNGRNLDRTASNWPASYEDLMPGPRPMPVALKLLRGNPGKRPLKRGFEPPQPPLPP